MPSAFDYKQRKKRRAFILANADYDHDGNDLANPLRDMAAVETALDRIGFDVKAFTNLDARNTFYRLDEFFEASGEDSETLLFYYSGHGLQLGRENYIVPVNFDPLAEDPRKHLVAVSGIIQSMAARSEYQLVFLDACRDNGGMRPAESWLINRDTARFERAQTARPGQLSRSLGRPGGGLLTDDGLTRPSLSNAEQVFISFAAEPGGFAQDGPPDGLSPFTEAVVAHAGTRGLELNSMAQRVRNAVRRSTETRQIPWMNANFTNRYELHPTDMRIAWFMALLGVLTGLLSSILAFDLFTFDFTNGLQVGDRKFVNVREEPIYYFASAMFGLVLAFASWRWGANKAPWSPVATFLIFTTIAVISRHWFAPYGARGVEMDLVNTITLQSIFGPGPDLELRATILIAMLAAAMTGIATVFSGAHGLRTLSHPTRIFSGAFYGALAAVFFFVFLVVRIKIIEFAEIDANETSDFWKLVESIGIMILFAAWYGVLAYNVGFAYARPIYEYDED